MYSWYLITESVPVGGIAVVSSVSILPCQAPRRPHWRQYSAHFGRHEGGLGVGQGNFEQMQKLINFLVFDD